jgi:hypothetical protein
MVNGPMQFGLSNDAKADQTTLMSSGSLTLALENSNQVGDVLTVKGGDVGIEATADPTSENGIAIWVRGGRTGLLVDASTARGDGPAIIARSDVRRSTAVRGSFDGRRGFGVIGEAQDNRSVGILGRNTGLGTGVLGETNSNTRAAVFGDNTAGGPGVFGFSANGFAGLFVSGQACEPEGFPPSGCAPLANSGGLRVVGEIIKEKGEYAEALPHPDGSKRLLYAPLSPESWYEDFGRAELVEGRTTVELDRDFAAVLGIEDGNYHVFLMAEGDCKGLYVSSRNASGFEVREQQDGNNTLTFSYRVVAKRQHRQPERLARLEEPEELTQVPQLDYPVREELPPLAAIPFEEEE